MVRSFAEGAGWEDTLRTELEQELADLRREVIEGRNLVIRTDNLLKTLHTEMKAFGARQKAFERRQMLSSAAAYALFALLAGAAALFLSGARTSAADSERDKAVAELRTRTISREYTIVDVSAEIAEEGARIGHRLRIPMADSLIMATSKSLRVSCVTDDPHFTEAKRIWV